MKEKRLDIANFCDLYQIDTDVYYKIMLQSANINLTNIVKIAVAMNVEIFMLFLDTNYQRVYH